jgi:predicted CXXCH cytochrome family protein
MGRILLALGSLLVLVVLLRAASQKIDPAAWGSDHVGKPLPEFATGDECLFCHRNDVGPSWSANRHARTVREVEPKALEAAKLGDRAAEVTLMMGRPGRYRFLRPSAEFGKLDLLAGHPPQWDGKTFAERCAGCHATAVDGTRRTFASRSLDCCVCHGDVPGEHAKDTTQVYLAKKRQGPARVVISICGQCHIRTGQARSNGMPYPNQFVAGDNLFRDFQADFSDAALARLNPGDRHVLENIRDVALRGREDVTCLSCHDVHKPSGKKHHRLARTDLCASCHEPGDSLKVRKSYEVHSPLCGY